MNKLQIFNNPEFGQVRTLLVNDEPYFVGKDVADALGYEASRNAIAAHVDDEDKLTHQISAAGQMRMMTIINESGVYSLVFGSKLESAKKFKRWVTSEVLPAIRKTGSYNMPNFNNPAEAARAWADEYEKRLSAQKVIELNAPKVQFYDDVAGSKDAKAMADVAKVLDFKGVGRNKLFEILRNKKILMHDNQPYQRYIDAGWFRVIEQSYGELDEKHISFKTLVYQKGIENIADLLRCEGYTQRKAAV